MSPRKFRIGPLGEGLPGEDPPPAGRGEGGGLFKPLGPARTRSEGGLLTSGACPAFCSPDGVARNGFAETRVCLSLGCRDAKRAQGWAPLPDDLRPWAELGAASPAEAEGSGRVERRGGAS